MGGPRIITLARLNDKVLWYCALKLQGSTSQVAELRLLGPNKKRREAEQGSRSGCQV